MINDEMDGSASSGPQWHHSLGATVPVPFLSSKALEPRRLLEAVIYDKA